MELCNFLSGAYKPVSSTLIRVTRYLRFCGGGYEDLCHLPNYTYHISHYTSFFIEKFVCCSSVPPQLLVFCCIEQGEGIHSFYVPSINMAPA
jgi:hypothetical protein